MKIFLIAGFISSILSGTAFGDLEHTFIELGKKANPAVVNIFTTQVIKNPYGAQGGGFSGRNGQQQMPMDPLQEFMEQFMGGGMGMAPPQEQRAMSLGSGFIIDETGLILTNNHVIQNATEIAVQLTEKSKKTFIAKVIGKDERTDIAVIKINYPGKLEVLPLGDSNKVEVGQWVAAFGNPFGHGHTMTKGIISAKERDVDIENAPQFPFLQTDASINPGNSGGPLVNLAGEVVGVNAAIDARAQGIGFAIPINAVKKILPDLKSKGKITRGFLGVTIADVDEKTAKEFHIKGEKGAFVTGIAAGSPAEVAGIQPYDAIIIFNGKEVENARQLMNSVSDTKTGDVATAQVVRNGKIVKLTIKIAEKSEGGLIAASAKQRQRPKGYRVQNVGVEIMDMNPAIARELNLPPLIKRGVVIIDIEQGSLAEQAGLHPGDIILDINKTPVTSASDAIKVFQKDFKKGSGGMRNLRVMRGANTMVVFMEID